VTWRRPESTSGNGEAEEEGETAWPLSLTVAGLAQINLDWWRDERSGGKQLKVWAGTMHGGRIARAMLAVLRQTNFHGEDAFNVGRVVPDPDKPNEKKEPFYFDARRGAHTTNRDVGFSPDAIGATTVAYPAVEFFCLVGLQRCRPRVAPAANSRNLRLFEYFTWSTPLPPPVASLAVQGQLPGQHRFGYRFESRFRTDQRKHKAFGPAIVIEGAVA
jgi:CRISPR-associated protein Csb3